MFIVDSNSNTRRALEPGGPEHPTDKKLEKAFGLSSPLPGNLSLWRGVYENFIFRITGTTDEIFVILSGLEEAVTRSRFFSSRFREHGMMEKPMRKIHTALLAGAVVAGLGAVALPSLASPKPTPHELTLWLPGGGTETITYEGSAAPQVKFHQSAVMWPAPFWAGWVGPSFVALDPVIADMDRQFEMLADLPFLMQRPDQPLTAALSNLPAGTSYSMVSEASGNGVCTRFTQVTQAPGNAEPKIVSQSSGNCGASNANNHAGETKAINLRDMPDRGTIQSL